MDDLKKLEGRLISKVKDARIQVTRVEGELAHLRGFKPPTRKNKLVSDMRRYTHLLNTGAPLDEERGSGRTTAMALRTLSQAMLSPGVAVLCEDHYKVSGARNREVAGLALHLADKLGLKHIEVVADPSLALVYTVMEG